MARNPIESPIRWIKKPKALVLTEAAMPLRVATMPRTRLKRQLPAVRSVITNEVSTPSMAPLMPSRFVDWFLLAGALVYFALLLTRI